MTRLMTPAMFQYWEELFCDKTPDEPRGATPDCDDAAIENDHCHIDPEAVEEAPFEDVSGTNEQRSLNTTVVPSECKQVTIQDIAEMKAKVAD